MEISQISGYYDKPKQLKLHKDTFSLDFINTVLSDSEGVLHFSGHGTHNFSQPRDSALIIDIEIIEKKTTEEVEGEIREKFIKEKKNCPLTAGELYHNVDSLVNYDLVSLSACEVGCASAETITAEFVGISSVLLSKGVKSVISPLWAVREDFSALLMMELHRRIREKNENPHVALDNSIEYLKNMTGDEYIKTPVYKLWLTNDLTAIYQETLNYREFEEISGDLATILEGLESKEVLSDDLIENLISELDAILDKIDNIRKYINSKDTKDVLGRLRRKLHMEVLNDLKEKHLNLCEEKLFDHPYYLASFTHQGMVDSTESL